MKTKIAVCIYVLMAIVSQGCKRPETDPQNTRLKITIIDLLTGNELRELKGYVDDISSGATYIQLKVKNVDKDTLYIFAHPLEENDSVSIYLPETVEYSYYDSLEMKREYHYGIGDNWGSSMIDLAPGSSQIFYFYNMTDYRTDSVTFMFDYKRDTIMDPDRECHVSITYLLKKKEVIANVGYEDTCAPKAAPTQENQ